MSNDLQIIAQKCQSFCGAEPPAEKLLSKIGRWLRFGEKRNAAKKPYALKLTQADRGGYLFVIKNHRTGATAKGWTGAGQTTNDLLTPQERAKLIEQRKQKERELQQLEQQERARVKAEAQRIWANAKKPGEWAVPHPYLQKKGITEPLNCRRAVLDGQDVLILPMVNVLIGETESVYRIFQDGGKYPLTGTRVSGLCMAVSKVSIDGCDEVWLVEGYATALSLYQQVEKPVVVGFSASNLEPVAERLQQRYPHLKIKLCADDDRKTAKKIGRNPGIEAAKNLQRKWPQISLYRPVWPPGAPESLSDINDLVMWQNQQAGGVHHGS